MDCPGKTGLIRDGTRDMNAWSSIKDREILYRDEKMTTYVLPVRGVTPSGRNRLPMSRFREVLVDAGLTDPASRTSRAATHWSIRTSRHRRLNREHGN